MLSAGGTIYHILTQNIPFFWKVVGHAISLHPESRYIISGVGNHAVRIIPKTSVSEFDMMYKTRSLPNTRIDVADALRGMAVAGIILYHSVEHFDIFT